MDAILDFLSSNAALLVAVVALAISLRANYFAAQAHKFNLHSKADADRQRLFEKKREVLNEIDKQHTTLATLSLVIAQAVLVFKECPKLHQLEPGEFDRLKKNLQTAQTLAGSYDRHRKAAEAIDVGADVAKQDEELANIRRLTIHLEKDVAHEQLVLDRLRKLAATAAHEA